MARVKASFNSDFVLYGVFLAGEPLIPRRVMVSTGRFYIACNKLLPRDHDTFCLIDHRVGCPPL